MRIHRATAFGLLGLALLFILWAVLIGVWEPFSAGAL